MADARGLAYSAYTPMADVAIIIVNWNTCELLHACLQSLELGDAAVDTETVVVDNASSDGSPAMVRERFPTVRLIENSENVGFARAVNQATERTDARYTLWLNSDAWLERGALAHLVTVAEREPRAGVVGARLSFPDGTFQASHAPFPTFWGEALILSGVGRALFGPWYPSRGVQRDGEPLPVAWVVGACMLVRRAAWAAVGGLDEGYFMYGEEMDLCYRLRQHGWQTWYQPQAQAVHHLAGSARNAARRERDLYRGRVRFFAKHYGVRSARWLAWQMYAFTAAKIVAHRALRVVSGGRRGRSVVPLRTLREGLAGAVRDASNAR